MQCQSQSFEDRRLSIRKSFKYAVVWSAVGYHGSGASLTNESTERVNNLLSEFFEKVEPEWFENMSNKDIGTDLFFELYGSPCNWKKVSDEHKQKILEVCDKLPEIHSWESHDPRYVKFRIGM